jgi:hypothetical protein
MDIEGNDSSFLCYVVHNGSAHLRCSRWYAYQWMAQLIYQPLPGQQAVNRLAAPVLSYIQKMSITIHCWMYYFNVLLIAKAIQNLPLWELGKHVNCYTYEMTLWLTKWTFLVNVPEVSATLQQDVHWILSQVSSMKLVALHLIFFFFFFIGPCVCLNLLRGPPT